jgi:hypothetical protein
MRSEVLLRRPYRDEPVSGPEAKACLVLELNSEANGGCALGLHPRTDRAEHFGADARSPVVGRQQQQTNVPGRGVWVPLSRSTTPTNLSTS